MNAQQIKSNIEYLERQGVDVNENELSYYLNFDFGENSIIVDEISKKEVLEALEAFDPKWYADCWWNDESCYWNDYDELLANCKQWKDEFEEIANNMPY
jgi:hypothetical protein